MPMLMMPCSSFSYSNTRGVTFIETIAYPTWLANVVMVQKKSGKWRMCIDFTSLNKACPKDNFRCLGSTKSSIVRPGAKSCHSSIASPATIKYT